MFGRGFDSRNWIDRKKFFSSFFFYFVVLETLGEILVVGSIPGVGRVNFFFFFQFGGVRKCP